MRLCQTLSMTPSGGPDDHYRRNHIFKVTIAGKEIPYVFCSRPFLENWGNGSKLGLVEDEKIFISKNLHPTQVPFVALYLFYKSRDIEELKKELGDDIDALEVSTLNETLIGTVLNVAADYLSSEHMGNLVNGFKKELSYDSKLPSPLLRKIVEKYSPSGKDTTSILKDEQTHLTFQIENMSEYLKAYGKNKYTKRSSLYNGLEEITGSHLFSADVAKCEPAFKEIVKDPVLEWNLPGVVEFIDQLIALPVGEQVVVGKTESYILYICSKKSEEGGKRSQRSICFVGDGPEEHTNIIQVTATTKYYFISLKKRLLCKLKEQDEKAKKAISDLEGVIRTINSESDTKFNKEFREILEQVIPPANKEYDQIKAESEGVVISQQSTTPDQRIGDLVDTVKTLEVGIRLQIAQTIGADSKLLQDAATAKALLVKLNLPTTEVDNFIQNTMEKRYQILRKSVGIETPDENLPKNQLV